MLVVCNDIEEIKRMLYKIQSTNREWGKISSNVSTRLDFNYKLGINLDTKYAKRLLEKELMFLKFSNGGITDFK